MGPRLPPIESVSSVCWASAPSTAVSVRSTDSSTSRVFSVPAALESAPAIAVSESMSSGTSAWASRSTMRLMFACTASSVVPPAGISGYGKAGSLKNLAGVVSCGTKSRFT